MINKNRSTVRVIGGLGNQLFGLFFGLAVATEFKNSLLIDLRLIKFGSNPDRDFTLDKIQPVYDQLIVKDYSKKLSKLINKNNIIKKLYWKYSNNLKNYVGENKLSNSKFKYKSNQIYQGYFQDWFYVDRFSKLNSSFSITLKTQTNNFQKMYKKLEKINPICIHLREGDYLKFPKIFKIIPQEYFDFALNLELSKDPRRELWIFTEEKESLQAYGRDFLKKATKIIDKNSGLTELESFLIMANCKTLIASNSTYSLWAAWFVWKNGNTAYVPYQSYIAGVTNDLMDERWNRYDFENDLYPERFLWKGKCDEVVEEISEYCGF
jgi:hypothetical protein